MKAAVLVFPGSNCDRDLAVSLKASGMDVTMVWHKETALPEGTDLVAVPGGFSYGDYLRCGAIAAQSPISRALHEHVKRGGYGLGICNGFQILTELGVLPGALLRNANLKYVCKSISLKVETNQSIFTQNYQPGAEIVIPVAHHDGNYTTDSQTLARLKDEDRIAFTYIDNPNGSLENIAGILSDSRRILGMMPHPERYADVALGGMDGTALFQSIVQGLVMA